MKEHIEKIKEEIEKGICEKNEWKKRAIKINNKEAEEYCNGALTQLYGFLGKLKELELLI